MLAGGRASGKIFEMAHAHAQPWVEIFSLFGVVAAVFAPEKMPVSFSEARLGCIKTWEAVIRERILT